MVKQKFFSVKIKTFLACSFLIVAGSAQSVSSPFLYDLIKQVKGVRGRALTQTEAHLRTPEVQEKIRTSEYDITPYKDIILQIINNGAKHVNTHYEFFHAQHGVWQIFQDTFKKLYQKFVNDDVASSHFHFMRFGYKDPFFSRYPTIHAFLNDELQKVGVIDDMVAVNSMSFVSANIALFGNIKYPGESTWFYFTESKSWFKPNRAIMEQIMDAFGCTKQHVDELLALSDLIATKEGRLFQILIPKSLTDNIVYNSWVRGIPYDKDLIKQVVAMRNRYPRPKIKEIVQMIKDGWKAKNNFAVPITNNLIEGVQTGRYDPSPLLEQYKGSVLSVPYFDSRQVRILVENGGMLNPESGIKMFRYSTINSAQEEEYKRKLDVIIEKIVQEKKLREKQVISTGQRIVPLELSR